MFLRKIFMIIILFVSALSRYTLDAKYFSDNFSDPSSGWGAKSNEWLVRGYYRDQYLMQVDVPDHLVWVASESTYKNVAVSVIVDPSEITAGHYGVSCRHIDNEFYYFAVDTDNQAAIYYYSPDGQLMLLVAADVTEVILHNTESPLVEVQAVCDSEELSMYIHDELVAQVTDDTLQKGGVGMVTGTGKELNIHRILFDDLEIQKPEDLVLPVEEDN